MSFSFMLKKILQTIFRPNHQPEMNIAQSSNSPFVQHEGEALAVELINRFWVNNKAANEHHSKAMVKNVAEKMMEDCRKVLSGPDPIMVNRQLLAESVLRCAKLQVLLISPVPEPDGTGLRGHLGMTGELKSRILDIVKIDKEFESFPANINLAKAGNQIQFAYRRAWAYMNVFEGLRHEYDDINPEQSKDWFRPFFASQCAFSESKYREELGMPNVLDKSSNGDATSGLKYGNFRDIVLNGDKLPDLVWEEKYPNLVNPKIIWNA